jgi:hypothetical protein
MANRSPKKKGVLTPFSNNMCAMSKMLRICAAVVLLSMTASCGENHRWMQKAEMSIPSSSYEACIRHAVSSIPSASVGGVEYGRFELHIHFQRPLRDVRVYIQLKASNKADLIFIGKDWSESTDEKNEFLSFSKVMSDALLHQCHNVDSSPN